MTNQPISLQRMCPNTGTTVPTTSCKNTSPSAAAWQPPLANIMYNTQDQTIYTTLRRGNSSKQQPIARVRTCTQTQNTNVNT